MITFLRTPICSSTEICVVWSILNAMNTVNGEDKIWSHVDMMIWHEVLRKKAVKCSESISFCMFCHQYMPFNDR